MRNRIIGNEGEEENGSGILRFLVIFGAGFFIIVCVRVLVRVFVMVFVMACFLVILVLLVVHDVTIVIVSASQFWTPTNNT